MLLLAVLFRYNNYLLYYTCCEWSFWAIFSILTQDYTKFRCFIFLQFSWPHKTSQKSDASNFSNFPYMNFHKNQMLYFSSMGTQNYTKIWRFNFLQFSWHEFSQKSETSIFSNFYNSGIHKNVTKFRCVNFWEVLCTRGTWKLKKNKALDFCVILCTRGHENCRKLKCPIFVNFDVPGSWKLQKIEASNFC